MTDDDAQLKHIPFAILCGARSIIQSSIGSSPDFAYTRDFGSCPFIISHCSRNASISMTFDSCVDILMPLVCCCFVSIHLEQVTYSNYVSSNLSYTSIDNALSRVHLLDHLSFDFNPFPFVQCYFVPSFEHGISMRPGGHFPG